MTFGERLKSLRQSLGWTQDKLAQEAKTSKSFLSEVENDKTNISGDSLLRIANALNVSLDYLMKGETPAGEKEQRPVEIPQGLSSLAERKGLTYKQTLTLLNAHHSLIARRNDRGKGEMDKGGWEEFYERIRDYLE